MGTLVKIRLSNCRTIKPFWADIDDLNSAWTDISNLIRQFINKNDRISIRSIHHMIQLHQVSISSLDGFEQRKKIIKDKWTQRIKKLYRNKGSRYTPKYQSKVYCINTKVDEWATRSIYPIPIPKVITNSNNLKDPSGINSLTRGQIENLLIDNCFGRFYSNTINYAKYKSGWKIYLHYNMKGNSSDDVSYIDHISPEQFLRMLYKHHSIVMKKVQVSNRIYKNILNYIYGSIRPYLSSYSYSEIPVDMSFGKYIISCDTSNTSYRKEIPLVLNEGCDLIINIKEFIKDTGISPDIPINVTFESQLISKEEK